MLIGGKVSRVRGTKVAAARGYVRRWEKSLFFISRCFLQALHRYSQKKKKKISFTCLSYKFHMIGSGAAYQVGKKGSR